MRILFYISEMTKTGGAQKIMSMLVNSYALDKQEVFLITDYPRNAANDYYIRENVKWINLDSNKASKIITNCIRIVQIRKYLNNIKPDVAISFLGNPNLRLLIAGLGLKVKKVCSVRNDPNIEYGHSWLKRFLSNFLFLYVDGLVFQTKEAQKYFWKKNRAKSIVIPNPVEDIFLETQHKAISGGIVSVGRLEPQKNFKLLIDAFAEISGRYQKEKLHIYGEGSEKETITNYIKKIGLTDKVIIEPFSNQIYDVLSKARIFVMSSKYEGIPNALLEALAVGVPCISTDCPCGGPRFLIENGKNGILVPCSNKEALATAMSVFLDDDDLALRLSTNAKKSSKRFSKNIVLKMWEKYIYQIAKKVR